VYAGRSTDTVLCVGNYKENIMKKETMKKMRKECKRIKTKCEYCEEFADICLRSSRFSRFCDKNNIEGIPSQWAQKDINKGT